MSSWEDLVNSGDKPLPQDSVQPTKPPVPIPGPKALVKAPKQDIVIPRYRDINDNTPTETIRRALKDVGQYTTNYRLTSSEKEEMEAAVWAFKKDKIRTSENEIVRIAINHLLDDYKKNGEDSLLTTMLYLLHK